MSTHEGEELAKEFGCQFFETSAKLRSNVDEILHEVVRCIRRKEHSKRNSSTSGCCCCVKSPNKWLLKKKNCVSHIIYLLIVCKHFTDTFTNVPKSFWCTVPDTTWFKNSAFRHSSVQKSTYCSQMFKIQLLLMLNMKCIMYDYYKYI